MVMNHSLCIIGALKDEIAGIRGRMDVQEVHSAGMGTVFKGTWHHQRILLVRSGIGRKLALQALDHICHQYSVSGILSIGFAGGLVPDLKLGDLVIADTIRDVGTDVCLEETDLLPVDGLWVERALKLNFPEALVRWQGRVVTIDRPVCKPAEKRRLGKDCAAMAVDMESSVLLRAALKLEIPFLSVRAISDSVDQELIDFSHCIDISGDISTVKAGWHVLTHPGLLPQVETLRKGSRDAAKNLTRFMDGWIRHLP